MSTNTNTNTDEGDRDTTDELDELRAEVDELRTQVARLSSDDDSGSDAFSRRTFLAGAGTLAAGGLAGAAGLSSTTKASAKEAERAANELAVQAAQGSIGAPGTRYDMYAESLDAEESRTKEYPVADVQAHGAVGDGVTDDSSAIQAAADSIGDNGVLYFGPGVYYLGSGVSVDPANVRKIKGENAHIITDTNMIMLSVEGSKTSSSAFPSDSNNQSIKTEEMMPIVEGLQFYSTTSTYTATGLLVSNTFGAIITDCHFFNLNVGLQLADVVRNLIVTDSQFWDSRLQHIHYNSVDLHQSIISDCHISYAERPIFIDDADAHNIHINGCDIEGGGGEQNGLASLIHARVTSTSGDISQLQITGCSIEEHQSASGPLIYVQNASSDDEAVKLINITGNELSGCANDAILIETALEILVEGNTFWGNAGYAVNVGTGFIDALSVTNNVLGNGNSPVAHGLFYCDVDEIIGLNVSNNTCRNLNEKPIVIDSSSSDTFIFETRICDNILQLNSTQVKSLSGYLVDVNAGSSVLENARIVGNQVRTRSYADSGIRVNAGSYNKVIIKENIQRGSYSGTAENFPAASAGNVIVADNLSN